MLAKKHELEMAHAAKEYIQQHYMRPVTILKIALELCTSESRLKRVFKLVFNTGIITFLTRVRMEKALVLVQENHRPIKEIAHLSGYKSTSSFNRRFKMHHGSTPAQWYLKNNPPGQGNSV